MAGETRSGEPPSFVSGADIRTFLFADMRGYTAYTQRHGDDAASALASWFADLVRETVPKFEGELLELRGDEALCVFRSARQALRASIELQRRLRTTVDDQAAFPLGVGMGLDAGEAVPTEGGYRGAALNSAARLCALAKPGEILATEGVAHLAHRVEGLRLVEGRSAMLKGMSRPVRFVVVVSERPLPPPVVASELSAEPSHARLVAIVAGTVGVLAAIGLIVLHQGSSRRALLVPGNSVGVIDATNARVVDAITKLGDRPVSVAYGAGSLWVANSSSDTVTQVNPKTFAVQKYQVGYTPTAITFLNGAVWVTTSGDGKLCEIQPGTPTCVATPYAGNGPTGITTADGALYVADSADDVVARMDTNGRITRRIDAGTDPTAITFGARRLWVTNESAGTLTPIDLPGMRAENAVPVGAGPDSVTYGDGRVWVTDHLANALTVISPSTMNGVTHPVPADPESIVVRGSRVWVACRGAHEVVVLDAKTLAPIRTIPIGGAPGSLASGPAAQVFVSSLPSPRPGHGGTLVIAAGGFKLTNLPPKQQFPSMDPASWRSANTQSWDMFASMGDGLVGYKRVAGADGETLVPDLAEQLPAVTNGGTTYSFTLRPGLHYSNGAPVKASDIRYEIERELIQNPPHAKYTYPFFFHSGIRGASGCTRAHCVLSQGVVVDDSARTIIFHLVKPNPDFLYELATPPAFAVPASTPIGDQLLKPIPLTGPYMLKTFNPRSEATFVRNPQFRQWSEDAQPQGYPDTIVWKVIPGTNRTFTEIEHGHADWTYAPPPPDRIAELATRHPAQLHPGLNAETTFMSAPVKTTPTGQPVGLRPPFNNPRVILAIDDALDRSRAAQLNGSTYLSGRLVSLPTCQLLPPNFAGYTPTCPYTTTGDAAGPPKLAQALQLAHASGTQGSHIIVTSILGAPGTAEVADYIASVLKQLGYHPKVRAEEGSCVPPDALALCGWVADYPAPGDFVSHGLCGSPFYCPPRTARHADRVYAIQSQNPAAGYRAWSHLDVGVTRSGSDWIPLWTNISAGFVSRRVSNFQWNPMQTVLLDQLAIK